MSRLSTSFAILLSTPVILAAGGRAEEPGAGQPLPGRDHWAFKPVSDPALPNVKDPGWIQSPIDRFVLVELERRGLQPTRPAPRRRLIRRATLDLIGLPPTPEEVDAFLADRYPDAFAKVVDRLLASPHYGERWGRHWLDVVRYADTAGDSSDFPVPQLYRYRNYVIDSLNRDKPYDVFIQEQIAGDLMPAKDGAQKYERIVATGYIALSRRFGSSTIDYPQHLTIEDTIDNLGRSVLALNIHCARCHDHKFDPVSSEDYYGLYGIFQSTRYPFPGIETLKVQRDLVPLVPEGEFEALMKPYQEELGVLEAERKRLTSIMKAAKEKIREGEKVLAANDIDDDQRRKVELEVSEAYRQRAELFPKWIEAGKRFSETAQKKKPEFEAAYAVADAEPAHARVHVKGDPKELGQEVPRRFLGILGGQKVPEGCKTSGRRELSQWLTDPQNPLTGRVMVNRIWHYHFGKGIVETPNNFGNQGRRPTHPRLLDYLARSFIRSGWSMKAMHRLIMLSATYQLDSRGRIQNATSDPNNDFVWKFNRQRLVAEAVRDSILAISGTLDRRILTTPHPFPDPKAWDFTQHKPFRATYHSRGRTIYLMTQRQTKHPFLAVFDGQDTTSSTGRRSSTTTPIQALFMMNDPFVHEQAANFAARLVAERSTDSSRVERAHQLGLGRPPTPAEKTAGEAYLAKVRDKFAALNLPTQEHEKLAWESYARVVLRMNEFMYVE